MDNKITTSFIPKESINQAPRRRSEPMGIVTLVAILLLVLSIFYFSGVFAYRFYLYNKINRPCPVGEGNDKSCGLKASLDIETRNLQQEKIERLKRLDTKLKLGTGVLNQHQTLRPFFDALSDLTTHNVQYKKFAFNYNEKTTKEVMMTLEGVASSYDEIAVQAKVFEEQGKSRSILKSDFYNFETTPENQVAFSLDLLVDSSLLSYIENNQ